MMSYRCSRCGQGKQHSGRLSTRCTLASRLDDLLDDGTGRIRPALLPLAESLLNADNPVSILNGLYTRKGKTGSPEDLLRRLGRGEIELTHEAFHTLQPRGAAAHLVLLYAQPCSRVVRLTIDDVVHDNDQVILRLGESR
ncbi:hypothetical protein AB0K74_25755 [Streptomyces sp. NPDC056159]|uniref:hypothetical protein n=1 Tax=Streptomyces sp. NPDC056159 TaxID=3155537 RepID=UPI003448C6CF